MDDTNPNDSDNAPSSASKGDVGLVSDIHMLGHLQAKWIEKQAEIAAEMGIESLNDFADLLQNMTTEEFRTMGLRKLKAVEELMASNLRISYIVAALANRMIDAPTRIAATHISAQEAILDRIVDLAAKAEADELYSLVATYSALPAPFAQTFYLPLDEEEVSDIANEAAGDGSDETR